MTPSEQAVERYLAHMRHRGLSPHTRNHRRRALARLAAALPVPLLDATPDILYEWRASLRTRAGSVAAEVSNIRSFYTWAALLRPPLVAENPALAIPVPKLPRRLPRPIPEADLMFALSCASPVMVVRQWIVLAGWCGLRCQEIARLRMENLRLRDMPPVVIVSADSSKGGYERVIELCPFVVAEMNAAGLPASGYAFTGAGGQPYEPAMVSRMANEHLRGCGITSKFHDLRHRFLTQIQAAGHDILVTQYLAGHASPTTTAGYAAFSRTGATAAVAALPVPGQELEEAS